MVFGMHRRVGSPVALALASWGLMLGAAGCEDDGTAATVRGTLRGPELVDFGDLPLGFEEIETVELSNLGTGPITVLAAEVVTEDETHDVEIVTNVVNASVRPAVPFEVEISMQALDVEDEPRESTLRFRARLGPDEEATLDVRVRARGVDRGLYARPNPVDFGSVRIGSAVRREVEVINLLSQPVDVFSAFSASRAQLDDGAAFFSVVTPVDPRRNGSLLPEGELLRPGERTVVEVEYRPVVTSVDELNTGRWTVRSCSDALCETTIDLRGRGARNVLSCEPAEVNFGTVQPELVRRAFVRCQNVSNVGLRVSGWELAEFSASEFAVEPPVDFPRLVEPGDSFEIAVSFTGATFDLGMLSQGAVDIFARTEPDQAEANAEIPMRGTSGGPQIIVDRELPFGSVLVDQQGRASLEISNAGFADLVFERFEITGSDADFFGIVGASPQSISRQETRRVDFTFDPDAARDFAATLVIETTDPLSPRVEVALTGDGVDLGPCDYSLRPREISFGVIPAQGQSTRVIVFDNVGAETCLLREARIDSDPDDVFRLGDVPRPSVLVSPGERQLLTVTFAPNAEEESTGSFSIQVSRSREQVTLRGAGGLGNLLTAPTTVDFGNVQLGCQARSQTVNLTNVGSTRAEIERFELISLEADGVFRLNRLPGGLPPPPGQPRPINAGQTLDFEVDFFPQSLGLKFARLEIELAGGGEPYVLPIRGEASERAFRSDRFEQGETNRVDVLWVLDNSNSMNFVLDLATSAAETIFEVLDDEDIDYQTSLVTTDVVGSDAAPCALLDVQPGDDWLRGSCGFFSDGDDIVQRPEWKIVTERTRPSPQRAFTGLLDVPRGGAVIESGLEAVRLALTPPRITGWNLGFLRTDADLAIIIISNEDDQGLQPVPFYTGLVTSLKGFAGRRSTINAIIPPVLCLPGSQQAGRCIPAGSRRYAEAALRTGGIVENIGVDGDASFEEQTAEFADKLFNVVFSATSLRALFPLSERPAPGTLEVRIDGGVVDPVSPAGGANWTYEQAGNRIRFTERGRPAPGSTIDIRYQTFCF